MRAIRWKTACTSILLAMLVATAATAEPLLQVEPSVSEVWTGYDCWVDVSVNAEVVGLTGFDLEIDFDETVVELVEVVEGPLPQSSGNTFFFWTTGPGPQNAIVVNGAVLGGSVDGPGALASIHFSGLSPGVSPVEFLSFELRDLENDPIVVSALDGTIEVSDPPTIYLTPPYTEVTEGAAFTIDVAINGALTDLTGYNLRIALDPNVAQFLSASEGPLPPTGGDTYFFWVLEDASTIIVNGAVLGSWVDGPGVLAHIEFFAMQQGVTDVEFVSADLRDIDNDPLVAFDEGAVVVVQPGGSVVETSSWSVIKSLYR